MSIKPDKDELQISDPGQVLRVAIEGVGRRDQVWVHVVHLDGRLETYFNYLDEGYTVVLQQIALLRDCLQSESLSVFFHWEPDGKEKRFHAVTAIRKD